MRILIWLLKALIFILLLGFAVKNDGNVTVRAYFDMVWHMPLVSVMLLMLAAGVALGASAMAGTVFMLRRELARLRKLAPLVPPSNRSRLRPDDPSDVR